MAAPGPSLCNHGNFSKTQAVAAATGAFTPGTALQNAKMIQTTPNAVIAPVTYGINDTKTPVGLQHLFVSIIDSAQQPID